MRLDYNLIDEVYVSKIKMIFPYMSIFGKQSHEIDAWTPKTSTNLYIIEIPVIYIKILK